MEIIDAQVHEVFPTLPYVEWQPALSSPTRDRVALELMMANLDAVGIDAALINPSFRAESQSWARLAVTAYPDRFRVQKTVDALDPDVENLVAEAVAEPGTIAIRAHLNDWRNGGGTEDLSAGRMDRLFPAVEAAGVPLFCFMLGDVRALAPVAARYPGLRLIVDHLGLLQGPILEPQENRWGQLEDLLSLAQFPNVAVKLCGADVLSLEPFPYHDVWPHLHRIIAAFGPERLMWASDFTRMRMGPPDQPWAVQLDHSVAYLRDTSEISERDKEWIFGGSIRSWLNWPAPAKPVPRTSYREFHFIPLDD